MSAIAYAPSAVAELLLSKPDGQVLAQRRLDPTRAYWIGRESHCDFLIDAPSVSRRHALVYCANGRWMISDTGSLEGLETEAGPILSTQLSSDRWVEIGGCYLWLAGGFREAPAWVDAVPTPASPDGERPAAMVRLAMEAIPLESDDPPAAPAELLVVSDDRGRVHLCADLQPLLAARASGAARLTIGRATEVDLQIAHPSVDPLHCVLVRGAEKWSLVDAGCKDGIHHDGKRWYRKRLEQGICLPIGRFLVGIQKLARIAPAAQAGGLLGDEPSAQRRPGVTRPSAFLDGN